MVGLGVLAVEVQLARTGENLPDDDPFRLDGLVAPAGAEDGAPLRMTWLGDSTAAGVGATEAAAAVPRRVALSVAKALRRPVDLTSVAVSGARVGDVLADQVPGVPADAELVVVDVGANDVTHLTSKGDFRSTYEQVLDALPESARVVLLGVPDMGAPPRLAQPLRAIAGVRGGTLDSVVADLAVQRDLGYVDIAGETGPRFRDDPGALFAADGYHPSDAGYELWVAATVPVVLEALDR